MEWYLVFGIWYLVLGTWYLIFPSCQSQTTVADYQIPSTECQIPNTKKLLPFLKLQPLALSQVALLSEPVLHRGLKAIERHASADFEASVRDGQGIVENLVVGEVAHREVVDPFDRTGLQIPIPAILHVDFSAVQIAPPEHLTVISAGEFFDLNPSLRPARIRLRWNRKVGHLPPHSPQNVT